MMDDLIYRRVSLKQARLRPGWRATHDGTRFYPPTDVYETAETILILVEVAGLEEGGYEIVLSEADRLLTISGRRQVPSVEARLTYHQLEIQQGEFVTQVLLPKSLGDTDQATAVYEDGFLVITLPKAERRRVPVRATKPERDQVAP